VAAGVAAFARPRALPRALGVDRGTAERAAWAVRLFAAREAALGAGAVHALRTGRDVRPWLYAAALGDGGDAVTFLRAARQGHLRPVLAGGLAVFAAAGLAADLVAAGELGDD